MWTTDDIKKRVDDNKVICFGKGTKDQPMCGFTARAIDALFQTGKPFEVINIFDDPSIRPALVEFSKWPTTPQVFVNGDLIGGSDIVIEEFQSGDLQKKIEAAFAAA